MSDIPEGYSVVKTVTVENEKIPGRAFGEAGNMLHRYRIRGHHHYVISRGNRRYSLVSKEKV
jgi:hypothetical protein